MAIVKRMMPDPSWPLAFACALSILALIWLQSPIVIYGSLFSSIAVLSLNQRFRSALRHWARAAIALIVIAVLLALSNAHAGGYTSFALRLQLLRLARFLLGLLVGTVIVVFWEPSAILVVLDRIRVPRTITYVLLSSMDSFSRIRRLGDRQVSLLSLKDLNHGLSARLRGYYRVAFPLTAVLLKRQLAHADSLDQRGFFEGPYPRLALDCSSTRWRLPIFLVLNCSV